MCTIVYRFILLYVASHLKQNVQRHKKLAAGVKGSCLKVKYLCMAINMDIHTQHNTFWNTYPLSMSDNCVWLSNVGWGISSCTLLLEAISPLSASMPLYCFQEYAEVAQAEFHTTHMFHQWEQTLGSTKASYPQVYSNMLAFLTAMFFRTAFISTSSGCSGIRSVCW